MSQKTDQNELGISFQFDVVGEDIVQDLAGDSAGFNRYGVRENRDDSGDLLSIDVFYRAMEPGIRKGLEIPSEFLQKTTGYSYGKLPLQLDHSFSQMANVGHIDPGNIWFTGDAVTLMANIPNTGNSTRSDVIADFTHEPPAITDGSIQFDPKSVELEYPDENWDPVAHMFGEEQDADPPRIVDGRILEFSLTPFPGGYDDGGLSPAFSEMIENEVPARNGRNFLRTKNYDIKEL